MEDLGASPFAILHSLTLEGTGNLCNLERTEFLGDSYFQYVISIKTLIENKTANKETLHSLKTEVVKNLTLLEKGNKKDLGCYLIKNGFSEKHWSPPCYTEETSSATQDVCDKSIADCVESLIGIYLLGGGQTGAINLLKSIELYPLSQDFFNIISHIDIPISEALDTNKFKDIIDETEKEINYKFKQKNLLLQAITHSTSTTAHSSFYIMAYAGEAIYQFLLTRSLYEFCEDLSPGDLTNIRAQFVHQKFIGSAAVKFGLHKKIVRNCLPNLDIFLETCDEIEELIFFKEHSIFPEQTNPDLHVPNCLKKAFLALLGSIYFDDGSLTSIWSILSPILVPSIRQHKRKINPIGTLLKELKTENLVWNLNTIGKKIHVSLTLPNGKNYDTVGVTEDKAKFAAATLALKDRED